MAFSQRDGVRVRAAAREALHELHPAGFGLAVVSGGDPVFAQGFGFADIESGRAQHPAIRQRIGSITKTMVGLCVMALVEEGRLSLDDPLARHVPELKVHGDAGAVRLRHLLTHTSGIGEVPTVKDVRTADATLWADTYDGDVLGLFPDGLTLEVPPESKWCYANLAFSLLGEIVARTEGAAIAEVVRRRIFAPLGMANSDLLDRPHPALSTPYHHAPTADARELAARMGQALPEETSVDGHNIRGPYRYIRGVAAGAVQSTLADMALYARALVANGSGIVSPETFAQMVAPHWRPDPRLGGWGLSFSVARQFGRTSFGHGGGVIGGWTSMLAVFPDEALAIVVHCNTAFEGGTKLFPALAAAVLDVEPDAATKAPVEARVRAAATGVYEADGGVLTNYRVMAVPGRLQLKARGEDLLLYARRGPWKGGVRLRTVDAADPDFLALEDSEVAPTRLALVRDDEGAITGLRLDGLIEMKRADPAKAWA